MFKFHLILLHVLFSFVLFLSQTNIYYTKIYDFFIGSSRPAYMPYA